MSRARLNSTALQRKNLLINGNFDIWQRNTSLSAGTGNRFCADRWGTYSIGTTLAPSQQAFTTGQTIVPNNPEYFHRTVVSSVTGSGNYGNFAQPIENVATTSGKTLTLSFWAKANTLKNIAVEFVQNFGTGGSPSAQVTGIGVTTCILTSVWQEYTITTTLPSISGKTLGTNNDDYLAVTFWFDAGSTFNSRTNSLGQQSGTFDIAQVQLEIGSVATDFENRSFNEELDLCESYYQKSYALSVFPGAINVVGIVYTGRVSYVGDNYFMTYMPKRMRTTTPTLTFYSPDTGTAGRCRGSDGVDYVVSNANSGAGRISFNWTTTSANIVYYFHWTAEAEL